MLHLLAGGVWPALTHPYKHGSRRDLWISSNSHKGKRSASQVARLSPRSDASIAALVRTAAAQINNGAGILEPIQDTPIGLACIEPHSTPLRLLMLSFPLQYFDATLPVRATRTWLGPQGPHGARSVQPMGALGRRVVSTTTMRSLPGAGLQGLPSELWIWRWFERPPPPAPAGDSARRGRARAGGRLSV